MAIDERYFYGAYGIDIEKSKKEIYDGTLKYKKDAYSIDNIFEELDKFVRFQREHDEQILAEIIQKYDFIVGSLECTYRLIDILPEGANIICSPYIENPTIVYAIKK